MSSETLRKYRRIPKMRELIRIPSGSQRVTAKLELGIKIMGTAVKTTTGDPKKLTYSKMVRIGEMVSVVETCGIW